MTKKLRVRAVICSMIFAVVALTVMLIYSANKVVVIADVAQDQVVDNNIEGTQTAQEDSDENRIHFMENDNPTNYLCIPLQEGIKAEDITIENHYMERQLWVHLKGVKENFYEKQAVSGNLEQVVAGNFEHQSGGIWLKFRLKDLYEYRSVLESDYLYIEFVTPRELYDKIIVIDAGHGGDDTGFIYNDLTEKEVTLDIVKRLKEKLDQTDIKVYYTRTEDNYQTDGDRMELANAAKADMFISVHVNHDEKAKSSVYGTETMYDDSFFIPGFGSVQLADCLEREVVKAISGKGNGLYKTEENNMLREAIIPAVMLEVGYLTNKQEAILLAREDYRDKVATGIYNAVMEAYKISKN